LWAVVIVVATGATGWGATMAINTFEPAVAADGLCSLIEAMENAADDAATHLDCVAGDGADVIDLPVGEYVIRQPHNSVFGQSGLPAVTGDLTINGRTSGFGQDGQPRTAVIRRADGAPAFRLFYVARAARLTLNDLTISRGAAEAGFHGGAIFNLGGSVVLNRCRVLDNEARFGGGLMNQSGTMLLVDSTVHGNRSAADGGGIANRAGSSDATLVAVRSTISGNAAAGSGGALANSASPNRTGTLELIDSAVADNRADEQGGGISQFGAVGATGVLRVVGGTIAGNVAGQHGGGICTWVWSPSSWSSRVDIQRAEIMGNQAADGGGGGVLAWYAGTSISIEQSAIDGNVAGNGNGGGLAVGAGAILDLARSTISRNVAEGSEAPAGSGGGVDVSDATASIALSTMSGNRAMRRGGGIWVAAQGGWGELDASVTIADSTIYDNEADGLGGGIAVESFEGSGAAELRVTGSIVGSNVDARGSGSCSAAYPAVLTSGGHNLMDDFTCGLVMASDGAGHAVPASLGDVVVDDLMLSELGDFGGPTLTHMPLDGSPVIDVGSGGRLRSPVDQRGFLREADGNADGSCSCDGGAVEARSAPPEPPHGYSEDR